MQPPGMTRSLPTASAAVICSAIRVSQSVGGGRSRCSRSAASLAMLEAASHEPSVNPLCHDPRQSRSQQGPRALKSDPVQHAPAMQCTEGKAQRENAPEAHTFGAAQVCSRMMPGYGEQMRSISLRCVVFHLQHLQELFFAPTPDRSARKPV